MQATIVMPKDAPLSKRERTKGYGAEVVLYDRDKEDREAIANGIASKRGATLVRPYDDPFVIAGQGTAGREIAEDMSALGLTPDIVVAPASGGGLIAGVATAVKARFPLATLIVAEPEGYDDHGLSLRAGHREAHHAAGRTICDALMAAMPGEMTFSINSKLLAQGVTASDTEVGAAVAYAYRELKLVVEPGGAVGLAALLAGRIDARQERRHRALRRQCRRRPVRETGRLDPSVPAAVAHRCARIASTRRTRSSRPGSCAGSAPRDHWRGPSVS
jgi:threonine dehydratase